MDESKKNRILLVTVIVIMLLVIIIGGILLHINKEEKKSLFKLKQLYVSDNMLVPFDKYFLGINDNRIINVVSENGEELYLNDNGIRYDGFYMKNEDTPIIYNTANDKLSVYVLKTEGPEKLFTINDVSEVIPLIYKNDSESLLGFVQYKDNDTYIYNFENKGLIVLDSVTLVGDKLANNVIYTYNKDNIIAKKNDKYGSVDINGKQILDYKYDDLINDGISIIYAVNNKYGIMNTSKEVVLKPKYKIVKKVTDGYLVGDDKLSFYDNLLKKIISNKIVHNISNYSLREDNSLVEYNVGSNYLIVNNNLEAYLDKEYKHHDMYVIKNKKVSSIKQIGCNADDVIYSYNNNLITIYSSTLEKKLEIKTEEKKIEDIIKVQNNNYYVKTNKKAIIFNKNGKKIKNSWGQLIYYNDRYLVYQDKNKVTFIDYFNEVLETIEGNDIIISNNRLIVDGNIYLIEG